MNGSSVVAVTAVSALSWLYVSTRSPFPSSDTRWDQRGWPWSPRRCVRTVRRSVNALMSALRVVSASTQARIRPLATGQLSTSPQPSVQKGLAMMRSSKARRTTREPRPAVEPQDRSPQLASASADRDATRVAAARAFGAISVIAALGAASIGIATPATAQCVAPKNISGMWIANDGGHYFMRRVGKNIWWLGVGPGFKNVFKGTTDFSTITGEWADVDPIRGSGTLTLKIHGEIGKGIRQLERISSTGDGFGGARWGKPCNDTG